MPTFASLRERLLRIQAANPDEDEANRSVEAVEIQAARLFKSYADAGKPGVFQTVTGWPTDMAPMAPEAPANWVHFWRVLRFGLATCYPLPSPASIGAALTKSREHKSADGALVIAGSTSYPAEHWQRRAEDDATVCQLLSELAGEPGAEQAANAAECDKWYPAEHYDPYNISAETLRQAAHDGRIHKRKGNGNRNQYLDGDVQRCWPHLYPRVIDHV